MKLCRRLSVVFLVLLSACSVEPAGDFRIFTYTFDFNEDLHGWQHGFADFPTGPDDSTFYELKYAYTAQPSSLNNGGKAIMLSGNNHSDDLFMFLKKRITDLEPNQEYIITFEVELASDARAGGVGIGGAPGEGVFLKVGATAAEPKAVIENNMYVMNIDKGYQLEGGEDMITIGDIAVPETATDYMLITRSNAVPTTNDYSPSPCVVRTNSKGELWLIVGTDSGFEGITTLYYTRVSVVFSLSQ